jgi:hypothetical protein
MFRDVGISLGWNVTWTEDLVIRVERSYKENHPFLITPFLLSDIEAVFEVFSLTVSHDLLCKYCTNWLVVAILDMELTILRYMNLFVENSSEVALGDKGITKAWKTAVI